MGEHAKMSYHVDEYISRVGRTQLRRGRLPEAEVLYLCIPQESRQYEQNSPPRRRPQRESHINNVVVPSICPSFHFMKSVCFLLLLIEIFNRTSDRCVLKNEIRFALKAIKSSENYSKLFCSTTSYE